MWKRKGAKGAVSVFLVLILVPMLTVSAVFVDASKLLLARSVAVSSGDLALNTALTNYDTMLKDMYGLFATAQDTDELYTKLEDYYKTCITSSGVSEEDADSYVNQIMASLGTLDNSETSDLLNMELVEFEASKVTGAALNNPTILKNQIVQFMKYRAPINTGLGFLNALESFSTLDKQTELVEKRTEYYKAQQTVMEKLQSAWQHITEYNKSELITDPNYFSKLNDNFYGNNNTATASYESRYKEAHREVVFNLYDTQNYVDYSASLTKLEEQKEKNAAGEEVDATVEVWHLNYTTVFYDYRDYYTNYNLTNLPTVTKIKTLLESFYQNLQSMEAYRDAIPTAPADAYELQYFVQNMRSGNITSYTAKLCNVYTTYQQLKNAMIWVDGYDLTEVKDADENVITAQSIKDTSITVNKETKTLSQHFSAVESKYLEVMNAASPKLRYFSDVSNRITTANLTDTSNVNSTVNAIGVQVESYVKTLEDCADELESASSLLNEAKTSIESGDLLKAKNSWKSSASDSDLKNTAMAKQDLAEIQDLGKHLNTEDIGKLISRLNNVASNLRKVAEQIKGYKFYNTYIGSIQSYDSMKSYMRQEYGDGRFHRVPISNTDLANEAASMFLWSNGNVDVSWINDSGTQVKLAGAGTDTLNFYSYLYTQFGDIADTTGTTTKTEDTANGKNLYDSIKSKSSSDASTAVSGADDGNKTSSNELSAVEDRPSKGVTGSTAYAEAKTGEDAVSGTSDGLTSLFSTLSASVAKMGVDLRDNLYVADYIMSMFSYDTIEKEYLNDNPNGNISAIQTLTLQPINAQNNFSYGKEVEYIIYGGTNSANTVKAYGSIYGIRLGFNLIYAFMDSEIRDSAFAMATPISAATLGVIPVPLIQAAIIIGIACCESGVDLTNLKDGKEVPLFKDKQTWYISVSGLINYAKGVAGEVVKDATTYVIDASSQKLSEFLDMTDEQLNENLDGKAAELNEHLGSAYDTLITRHANTAIQKATTLINDVLCIPNLSQAEQEAAVAKGLDDWLAMEGTGVNKDSDIAYIAKKAAVDVIKSQFIPKLIVAIQSPNNTVENAGQEIMSQIADVRAAINREVLNANEKIKSYKSEMLNEVKESMSEGADKLKETLNSKIDGIFAGGSTKIEDKTMTASLLSFAYSDYLRLFLMIGLYTNEEGVLLRTADAIQENMSLVTKKDDYLLSSSAVYVKIDATIRVKPTLMAVPLFKDAKGNPFADGKGYEIQYSDVRGY